MVSKKPSQSDYFRELAPKLGFPDPIDAGRKPYELNMRAAQQALQSELLTDLVEALARAAESYADNRPELLFNPSKPTDLQVLTKSYESVLSKVYRLNCVYNDDFPSAPNAGFVEFASLYDHRKMNDLLRGRLVCKYMDGPRHVAEALRDFCQARGLSFHDYPMHSATGYHAWHCYIRVPVEIMVPPGNVEARQIWFELQLTTQLAEVITTLTHGLYADNRTKVSGRSAEAWQWDPASQQFRSAYLGHTLHLLEGVIQMFRDEVLGIPAVAPEARPIVKARPPAGKDKPVEGEQPHD